MKRFALLAFVAILAGCGTDPETPATPGESRVTAKAVADVDAAMAEARRAPAPAGRVAPVAPVAAPTP